MRLNQTEKQFQRAVQEYARIRGWLDFHDLFSKGKRPGWPDLVLLRAGQMIFAELKSAKGQLTDNQRHVLGLLEAVEREVGFTGAFSVHVWRPADWPEIEQFLF